MFKRLGLSILGFLFISSFLSPEVCTAHCDKITILNPGGIKPEIRKIPMAPRPETLNGKTFWAGGDFSYVGSASVDYWRWGIFMHLRIMWLVLLVIGFATIAGCSSGKIIQRDSQCDRACLIDILESYLEAVAKHDPSLAPLAHDYRGTENAEDVGIGEGHWRSISALGEVQRRYADPVTGQVGFVGLIKEIEDHLSIASVRLRVEEFRVTEAEWVIARKGMAHYNPKGFVTNPPLECHHPEAFFPDRTEAIRIVNSYFNGIAEADGKGVIEHPECYRIENGSTTVGRKPEWPTRSPDHDEPVYRGWPYPGYLRGHALSAVGDQGFGMAGQVEVLKNHDSTASPLYKHINDIYLPCV